MNIREESIFLKAGMSSECLYEAKKYDLSNFAKYLLEVKQHLILVNYQSQKIIFQAK